MQGIAHQYQVLSTCTISQPLIDSTYLIFRDPGGERDSTGMSDHACRSGSVVYAAPGTKGLDHDPMPVNKGSAWFPARMQSIRG